MPRSLAPGVRFSETRAAMRPPVVALLCVHLAAFSAVVAAGSVALAQPRPPRNSATARMSCAEAMNLVRREGDVVIAAGPVPERFVAGPGQCGAAEIAELRFVPTRDNPQCPIGYRCREPGFEEWNW